MRTMDEIRDGLEAARGRWPQIARDTEIDYFTIARIARGETRAPRIDTFQKIDEWLAANLPAAPDHRSTNPRA